MRRTDLEHIIRAAATIADDDELVIVGSQAVLAEFPNAPKEMLRSDEVDVYPKNHPERWELIDGAIGELSTFHDTFGYYAQGVEEGVANTSRWLATTPRSALGAIHSRSNRLLPGTPRHPHLQVRRQPPQGSQVLSCRGPSRPRQQRNVGTTRDPDTNSAGTAPASDRIDRQRFQELNERCRMSNAHYNKLRGCEQTEPFEGVFEPSPDAGLEKPALEPCSLI